MSIRAHVFARQVETEIAAKLLAKELSPPLEIDQRLQGILDRSSLGSYRHFMNDQIRATADSNGRDLHAGSFERSDLCDCGNASNCGLTAEQSYEQSCGMDRLHRRFAPGTSAATGGDKLGLPQRAPISANNPGIEFASLRDTLD